MYKHRKAEDCVWGFGEPAPKPPPLVQGAPVFQFPRAAVTKCHTLGGFKQQKLIVAPFWRLEVPNQSVGRAVLPLKSLGEDLFCLCYFLAVACDPGSSLVCRRITLSLPLLSHHVLFVSEPPCPNFPFLIRTPAIVDLEPVQIQSDLILILFLLRCNCYMTLYSFQVYTIMI